MRAVNVLLAVLVSLGIALLVLEGGLRLIGLGPPKTLNEFHEKYGWRKRPHAVVHRRTSEFDVTFEINSRGLRDDEIEPKKPEGQYRAVALGDSFVLGYTVDREDLFVDLLESWWRDEGRDVEVVNGGTEGYSTDQEVRWFEEEGATYAPDIVLLFPYLNDVYWNGQDHYGRYPKPLYSPEGERDTEVLQDPGPPPFAERYAVTRLLGGLLPRRGGGAGYAHPEEGWTVPAEFTPLLVEPPELLADPIARTRGALSALKERALALDAQLLVVPIPPEVAVHEDEVERWTRPGPSSRLAALFAKPRGPLAGVPAEAWDPERPTELFLEIAAELGIETADPRPALRAAAADGERLYFEEEWHLTPAGNRVLAGFLHDELDRRGLLPEGGRTLAAAAAPAGGNGSGLPTWVLVFAALWLGLAALYKGTYRDEPVWRAALGVGALLAVVFGLVLGGTALLAMLPPAWSRLLLAVFVLGILGFVGYKLGRRLAIIAELLKAFVLRGHWYLMPLVVVLLTIGSLLVVAASSPFVAPFIYTLF